MTPEIIIAAIGGAVALVSAVVTIVGQVRAKRLQLRFDREQVQREDERESQKSAVDMAQFMLGEARKTEADLRDRLATSEQEFAALLKDHRELSDKFDTLQYDFRDCKRTLDAAQRVAADQERKLQEALNELESNRQSIDLMRSQIRDQRTIVQNQSAATEFLREQNYTLRQRVELYQQRDGVIDDLALDAIDTKLLGSPANRDEHRRYLGGEEDDTDPGT
jgi:chromosome segregation ATPase